MIARFFLLWIFLALVVFGWIWAMTANERRQARHWIYRGAIAALIALVLLAITLSLNNISGV